MIFPREPLKLVFDQYIDALSGKAIPLEDVCTDCEGKGERSNYERYNKTCSHCGGSGVVLNDNGRAIIQLISCHMKSSDSNVLVAQRDY